MREVAQVIEAEGAKQRRCTEVEAAGLRRAFGVGVKIEDGEAGSVVAEK